MMCPICEHLGSAVLETRRREVGDLTVPARRRRCDECGEEWWTLEIPANWVEEHE